MIIKFYKCIHCGQIIAKIKDTKVPVICCGDPMMELVPNTTDASTEKHIPIYEIKDNIVTVEVGSIPHPATAEHHIEWIMLVTNKGNQRKILAPTDAPTTMFMIAKDEKIEAILAYCNLHGLWMKDLRK
ncbi:MAG: desulfoferrodoxin family protein [Bacilli bacterium]